MAKAKPFSKYGVMLNDVLSGAWHDVSSDFSQKLVQAFSAQDLKAIDKMAGDVAGLGKKLTKAAMVPVRAIYSTENQAAVNFWAKHAKTNAPKKAASDYQLSDYLLELEAIFGNQIEMLASTFPERLLHPEIMRQLELLKENPFTRTIDVQQIAERVRTLMSADRYWEGFTSVHASRLWQANAVHMAGQNNVDVLQIVEVMDKRTCGVCRIFHGQEIKVSQMKAKLDSSLEITDPDEYIDAWKFPRFNEVQLLTPADLTARCEMPPYHGHCRGSVRFLYTMSG